MIDLQTVLFRLAMAMLFGAIIGIERQWRQKNAGIKTNALVALGAAGFAIVSDSVAGDPARIAAAIVTGVGFLGAGVILHRGASVQGVTTAATLWANTAMAVASGMGRYTIAVVLFAGVIAMQAVKRPIERILGRFVRKRKPWVELSVECEPAVLGELNALWSRHAETAHIVTLRRSTARRQDHLLWRASFRTPAGPLDLTSLEEQLVALRGVRRVDVSSFRAP